MVKRLAKVGTSILMICATPSTVPLPPENRLCSMKVMREACRWVQADSAAGGGNQIEAATLSNRAQVKLLICASFWVLLITVQHSCGASRGRGSVSSLDYQAVSNCTTHVITCCGHCRDSQAHYDRCQDNSQNRPQQPPFRLCDGLPAKSTAAQSGGQGQLAVLDAYAGASKWLCNLQPAARLCQETGKQSGPLQKPAKGLHRSQGQWLALQFDAELRWGR